MRRYPDIVACHLENADCWWISDLIIRGRRVKLRGIAISFEQKGNKLDMSPSIPCMGPALRLLKKRPELTDITFDRKKRKWRPTKWSKP